MGKYNREIRARASLECRSITDAEKAAGYIGAISGVIPFNSDSVTLTKRGRAKPFVEQISPEAFKRSISEDKDIMANAGHTDDPLAALGRIGENLTVTIDDKNLRWDALVPNTKASADLLELIDKRIICGTSFEFEVRGQAGEKWEVRDAQTDQRTILDARLIAFNPVTWPAYTDSSLTVELRRRDADDELSILADLLAEKRAKDASEKDASADDTQREEREISPTDFDRERRYRILQASSV